MERGATVNSQALKPVQHDEIAQTMHECLEHAHGYAESKAIRDAASALCDRFANDPEFSSKRFTRIVSVGIRD